MCSHEYRLDYEMLAPDAAWSLSNVYRHLESCSIEGALLNLIYLRVSQLNNARRDAATYKWRAEQARVAEDKLVLLSSWRKGSTFTPKEQAALEWAEALTCIPASQPTDEDFRRIKVHFTDREMADLCIAIAVMNAYNRLSVGLQAIRDEESVQHELGRIA